MSTQSAKRKRDPPLVVRE